MLYDKYERKIKRLRMVRNTIIRYKVLIICLVSFLLATATTLLSINGMVVKDVTLAKNTFEYGDKIVYDNPNSIFNTGYRIEFAEINSEEWTTEEPTLPNEYKMRVATVRSFNAISYGKEQTFTITKKNVQLSLKDKRLVYGEMPELSNSALVANHSLTVNDVEFNFDGAFKNATAANSTFAGLVEIENQSVTILDKEGNNVTENYQINTVGSEVEFSKRPVYITSASLNVEYKGEAYSDSTLYATKNTSFAFNDKAGLEKDATVPSFTDIGPHDNIIEADKVYIQNETYGNVTKEFYNVIDVLHGIIDIGPRTVTFSVNENGVGKVYDGTTDFIPQTSATACVDADNLLQVETENIRIYHDFEVSKLSYDQIYAGNVQLSLREEDITITDQGGNDVSWCYNIVVQGREVEITKRPVKLTQQLANGEKVKRFTYDATPKAWKEKSDLEIENASGQRGLVDHTWEIVENSWHKETNFTPLAVDNNLEILIKDIDGKDVSANYIVEKDLGKIEIQKRVLTVNNNIELKREYDGTTTHYGIFDYGEDINNLVNGHSVTLSVDSGSGNSQVCNYLDLSPTSVQICDTDKNDVRDNYDATNLKGKINLNIVKRNLSVKTLGASKVYDGTPLTCDKYEITNGSSVVVGETVYIKNADNLPTITDYDINGVDNNFTIYINDETFSNTNYDIKYPEIGKLKIKKRPISFDILETSKIYDTTRDFEITSTDQTQCVIPFSNEEGKEQGLIDAHILTVKGASTFADAKSYTVPVYTSNEANFIIKSGDDNVTHNYSFDNRVNVAFTILQRKITVTIDGAKRVYNGEPLTCDGYKITNREDRETVANSNVDYTTGLVNGQSHFIDTTTKKSITEYENGGKLNDFKIKIVDDIITKNYDIKYEYNAEKYNGYLIIDKRPVSFPNTIEVTKTYDAKTDFEYGLTSNDLSVNNSGEHTGLLSAHKVIVTGVTNSADVSTYYSSNGHVANINVQIVNGGADVAKNYDYNASPSVDVEITKKTLDLSKITLTKTRAYNGEKNFNFTNVACADLVGGQYINFEYICDSANVGNYTKPYTDKGSNGTLEIYSGENSITLNNYDISNAININLTIRERKIIVNRYSKQQTYNGTPLTNATATSIIDDDKDNSYVNEATGIVSGQSVHFVVDNVDNVKTDVVPKITNVGTENNTYYIGVFDEEGNSQTANYAITYKDYDLDDKYVGSSGAILKITPIYLFVKTYHDSKTYNGTPISYLEKDGGTGYELYWSETEDGASKTRIYFNDEIVTGETIVVSDYETLTDVKWNGKEIDSVENWITLQVLKGGENVLVEGGNYVYDLTNQDFGTLTITPIYLFISTGEMEKTYDGTYMSYLSTDVANNGYKLYWSETADGAIKTQTYFEQELVRGEKLTYGEYAELKDVLWDNGEIGSIVNKIVVQVLKNGDNQVSKNYVYDLTPNKQDFGTLTITPIYLFIETNQDSKMYDATPISYLVEDGGTGYELYWSKTENGNNPTQLKFGDTIVSATSEVIKTPVNGEYATLTNVKWKDGIVGVMPDSIENWITLQVIKGGENVLVDYGNYVLSESFGTLTITPRCITVTTPTTSWVYNGEAHSNTNCEITGDGLVDHTPKGGTIKHSYEAIDEPTFTNVTDTYNSIKYGTLKNGELRNNKFDISIIDEQGRDKIDGVLIQDNYSVKYSYGKLEITPIYLKIETYDRNKVYDGEDISYNSSNTEGNSGYTLSYRYSQKEEWLSTDFNEQLVDGEKLTLSQYTHFKDVGTDTNSITITVPTGTKDGVVDLQNYKVETYFGTLTITPIYLFVETGSQSEIYNDYTISYLTAEYGEKGYKLYYSFSEQGDKFETDFGSYIVANEILELDDYAKLTEVGKVRNILTIGLSTGKLSNYVINTDDCGWLTITKRPITLTLQSYEKVYDGLLLYDKSRVEDINSALKEGSLVSGQELRVADYAKATNVKDSCKNYINVEIKKGGVGDDLSGNYQITWVHYDVDGKTEIAQSALTITPIYLFITTNDMEKTYDGVEMSYLSTEIEGNGYTLFWAETNDGNGRTQISFGDSIIVGEPITNPTGQYGKITKVGTEKNSITITVPTGNKDGVVDLQNYQVVTSFGTLTVTARPITITFDSHTWKYDGKAHSCLDGTDAECKCYIISTGELVDGQTITIATKKLPYITDIGSVDNLLDISDITISANGIPVTSNYDITIIEGTLTIEPAIIYLPSIIQRSKEYDAQTEFEIDFNSGVKGLIEGHKVIITVNTAKPDVGVYEISEITSISIVDADDKDVSGLYDGVSHSDTKIIVTVTQRELEILTESAKKNYDGQPLQCIKWVISNDNLITGHKMTMEGAEWASQTEVGERDNTFVGGAYVIIDRDGNDVSGNYKITTVLPGKLTVTSSDAKFAFGLRTIEHTYDGNKIVITKPLEYIKIKELDSDYTLNDIEYQLCYLDVDGKEVEPIDVGTYYLSVKITGGRFVAENPNWQEQNLISIEKGKITISPADVQVECKAINWDITAGTDSVTHTFEDVYQKTISTNLGAGASVSGSVTITIERDGAGNVIGVTDGKGNQLHYNYYGDYIDIEYGAENGDITIMSGGNDISTNYSVNSQTKGIITINING